MTIAPRLRKYLDENRIQYDLIPHEATLSSLGSAHAGHIPSDKLAKGVMLSNGNGYMLAVLPASHHLRMSEVKSELGHEMRLATEPEIEKVFSDCDRGAIPPVGPCYGLNVIIDDSVHGQEDLYFEGGDHTTLVHVPRAEFTRLNPNAQHGSFSMRE